MYSDLDIYIYWRQFAHRSLLPLSLFLFMFAVKKVALNRCCVFMACSQLDSLLCVILYQLMETIFTHKCLPKASVNNSSGHERRRSSSYVLSLQQSYRGHTGAAVSVEANGCWNRCSIQYMYVWIKSKGKNSNGGMMFKEGRGLIVSTVSVRVLFWPVCSPQQMIMFKCCINCAWYVSDLFN